MRLLSVIAAALLLLGPAGPARAQDMIEAPMLAAQVAEGKLPPVAGRVPAEPLLADFSRPGRAPGLHGGDLNMLIPRDRYLRHMVVYGYARIVGYDESYNLVPDIARDFTVEEGRIFTFHLRQGHRWSDGKPLTSEDFRYWWEDIVLNEELNPGGIPAYLKVDGAPPVVEFPDSHTVRYTWPKPNPYFLPRIASASPLFIYRPAHFLKKFHVKYADPDKLAKAVEESKRPNWASLHNRQDRQYRFDNRKMPTLQPWRIVEADSSSGRFVAERNPYYHKIDVNGRQLPYLDRLIMTVAAPALIAAQATSGQTDLQALGISLNDWTFLKTNEQRGNYTVRAWDQAMGSTMALFPNLNQADPVYRALFRDARFRRALSLAIDRKLISEVIFFGDAREAANTILPLSPMYDPELATRWSTYNKRAARALLDEIGLRPKGPSGIRQLPDGRPLELIVETSGEDPQQVDILELIAETWREVGIKLFIKPSQRDTFRNRVYSGQAQIAAWTGIQAGLATPEMSPEELAPTTQEGLQWPQWGLYYESSGQLGTAPDMEIPARLVDMVRAWNLSTDLDEKRRIWREMLEINADQVFSIGVITSVPQPVVVRQGLRNVPENGVYHWDPGAYFGLYHPDSFWYEPEDLRQRS